MARMVSLLRFFSITSFISILIATALLALFCRQLVIPQTIQLSEVTSQQLAKTLLTSIRPELDYYLASLETVDSRGPVAQALSARLSDLFKDVMREAAIVRVKLYNRQGIVVFSTDRSQIGDNQAKNAGVILAASGGVASGLTYRDTVNRFEGATERDDLMETYVPVRASSTGAIHGVFEIYTDMNRLVSHNQRTVFTILVGVGLILLCHFAVLIFALRRASYIMESERHIDRHRTSALERLSAGVLNGEETERRRIATELQEGIAQTLSAIKFRLEHGSEQIAASNADSGALKAMVPLLQNAIQEVQILALKLRPSSLDDLGLLSTIEWFCGQFQRRHPKIRVEPEISLQENEVPGSLKIVIYRIMESVFGDIAQYANTDRIQLSLRLADQTIILAIDDSPHDSTYAAAAHGKADADLDTRFVTVQQRATLSGGTFSAVRNKDGGITLRATWTF